MNDQKSRDALLAELTALRAEKENILAYLAEVPKKEARLKELDGNGYGRGSHWHREGLIEKITLALRDSEFPVFESEEFMGHRRIVAVSDKWITLRRDGDDEGRVTRYRRADGCKQGTRSPYDVINVKKALEVWEAHSKNS